MIDQALFPKGRTHITALDTTAQTVVAAGARRKFTHFIISGGNAAEIVIFRAVDDAPEYFRVAVPAASTVVVPGFDCGPQGLEVATVTAAGDVYVTAFYVAFGALDADA